MAFIGNTNTTQAFTPAIDYFSGNASTTAFTLSRPIASVAQIQVVVNNVAQNPSSAYTVSGNTITFTSAPSAGTNNIYVYYTSPITQVVALPQNPQVFGNLQFSSSGARITGDFSNATIASRVSFQDSTTNNGTYIQALPNGTSQGSGIIVFNNSTPTNAAYMALTADATTAQVNASITGTGTYLPMTFRTGGSERMRVDTSGNVGIGTSSPASILDVKTANDALVNVQSTGTIQSAILNLIGRQASVDNTWSIVSTGSGLTGAQLRFTRGGWTGTPSMLIDSSGYVGIGTTSPSTFGFLSVENTNNVRAGWFYVNVASSLSTPAASFVKKDNNTTTSQVLVNFYTNGSATTQGQINANGANAAAFGSFSDSRLKENIVDLPSQLANIMALRPVEFDYIESEGGGHQIGFVAQEVQGIYPDLVGEREDGMLTLSDLNKNDARLIKAIQEMKAIIDTQANTITALTARITALENK